MSEIYPVDDLEWENNSIGNSIRPAILELNELSDDECGELLDTLNEHGLADQRPVSELIGLAPDANTFWQDLRVGELKTLLALAIGDEEAILEGCDWVRHFEQLNPQRRKVYLCIESLLNLEDAEQYHSSLKNLYGAETLQQALALLNNEQRFFGLPFPGMSLEGCHMHQRLLEAYAKLHAKLL
jgi:ribosomal protein S12 methylthiotransferase accessory factor